MHALVAKALLIAAASTPAHTGKYPWWLNNEEGPPGTFALWLGIGLVIVVIVAILAGLRWQRWRRLRAASVLPDDPFAVEAMQACVRLLCRLEPAWRTRDRSRLSQVVGPRLLSDWGERLQATPTDELAVDGPLRFQYLGAADPPEEVDRRAVVRLEGRLRAESRQVALSRRQRNGLLGLAGVILVAAFVGIALAPATKIRSSGPTTIVVRGGVPLGGTHLLAYRKGALINLTVRSNVADEVHVHGYDIHKEVSPGHPVHFLIPATIEGSYPVELEQHAQTLAQVTVQP